MDELSVAILLVNVDESAFNPNAVLISDVLAFNAIAELSVEILLANVVESAFNAIAVVRVFVLFVHIKSFWDFVYTSAEFAFNRIDVLSVDILLVNVAESAFYVC